MKENVTSGAIYGIGVLGAIVYTIYHTSSVMDFLWGLFFAFFWPGVVVYKVFEIFRV